MTLIDWQKMPRTCFCGVVFMPKTYNQTYCCDGHQRVHERALKSAYGRKLIRADPAAAIRWYAHLL